MSNETAISLKNISKVYKRYHRPVDRLKEALFPKQSRAENFWALNDINLEIAKGETVGIIGRNGSGKSTLLQIIAGTLQPTAGEVDVQGRVSALLELGSGFNPEFTGRQNTFFNGRILGLSQEEIAAKFDDIAAFADIGDFIDQPVKTYSSGMFVRLAFAVAINAEPDILIVDEALSVGDEAFQRKCFARIYDVQERGATVLFVSHSSGLVVELCDRATMIDDGEIILEGIPNAVLANYRKFLYAPADKRADLRETLKREGLKPNLPTAEEGDATNYQAELAPATEAAKPENALLRADYDPYLRPQYTVSYQSLGAKIKNPVIKTLQGKKANLLVHNERYLYSYSVYFAEAAHKVRFGMLIKTVSGFELGGAASHIEGQELDFVPAGTIVDVEFEFLCSLLTGTYFLNAGVTSRTEDDTIYLHRIIDAIMFKVNHGPKSITTGIVDFGMTSKVSMLHITS